MKCSNCGMEVSSESSFCNYCGNPILSNNQKPNVQENIFINNQQNLEGQNVELKDQDNITKDNLNREFFESGYNAPIYNCYKPSKKSSIAAIIVGILICCIIIGTVAFFAYKVLKNADSSDKITCTVKNNYIDSYITLKFNDGNVSNVSGNFKTYNSENADDMSNEEANLVLYHSMLYLSFAQYNNESGVSLNYEQNGEKYTVEYNIEKSKIENKDIVDSLFDGYTGLTKQEIKDNYEEIGFSCK